MTNNQLTDERIEKIAVWLATESHSLNLEMLTCLRELQERRKAAMDSEPVAVVEPSDYVTAAQLVGEGPARKAVRELYEGALRIGDKLYRQAQPAPVVNEDLYILANHIASSKSGLPDEWLNWAEELETDIRRAAMLHAEPVTTANKLGNSPVIPDGYVMVPKEPTDEMNRAGWAAMNEHDAINPTYRAMLAAAPQEVKGEHQIRDEMDMSARITSHRFKV